MGASVVIVDHVSNSTEVSKSHKETIGTFFPITFTFPPKIHEIKQRAAAS